MKHVDAKALEPAARKAPRRKRPPFDAVLAELEHGVIIWGADRTCEYVNKAVHDLLEISEKDLAVGTSMQAFVARAVQEREYNAAQAKQALDAFDADEPLRILRTTRSRRRVLTLIQKFTGGRVMVTLTDQTKHKRHEAALAAARAGAEATEKALKAEIAAAQAEAERLKNEQRSLERLSLVAAHAKDLVVISDATNRIEWANEAYRRHNGLDLEMDLKGKSARDVLVGERTDLDVLAEIDEAVRARRAITVDVFCYRRTGEPYWMEQEITPVFNAAGEHTNFIMVGRDVTERLRAQQSEREAQRFEESKRDESRLLAEFNEWLQSTDTLDELFQVVSSFLEKLLPGSEGAVHVYGESRDVLEPVCAWPGDVGGLSHFEPPDCWALRRGRAYFYGLNAVDFPCTHVSVDCGGETPPEYYCLPIIAHGDTVGLLHVKFAQPADDMQERQKLANFCAEQISLAIANVKLREQLREQSTRDPLTGLYNRRYFLDYAKREIVRCAAAKKTAGVVMLDIDHFKKFNDTYGHDAGDAVLKMLAEVLQTLFREGDVPCRLGGEEFIVMLPGASLERARERAEELRSEIEAQDLRYGGQVLKVTSSLGVAGFPVHGKTLDALMQEADEALYAAKSEGRNRVKLAGA